MDLDQEIEKLHAREYELKSKLSDAPMIANGAGLVTLISFSSSASQPLAVLGVLEQPLFGFSLGLALGFGSLVAAQGEAFWHRRTVTMIRTDLDRGNAVKGALAPLQSEYHALKGLAYRERRRAAQVIEARLDALWKDTQKADDAFNSNEPRFKRLMWVLGFWTFSRVALAGWSIITFVAAMFACLGLIFSPTPQLIEATNKFDAAVMPQLKAPSAHKQ